MQLIKEKVNWKQDSQTNPQLTSKINVYDDNCIIIMYANHVSVYNVCYFI